MTVIKAISSMSRAGLLMCWFILAFVSAVKSQPPSWDGAHGLFFRTSSCFESLGKNKNRFRLFHNLPLAPPHIGTVVYSHFVPADRQLSPTINNANQHYFRVDNDICSESYEVSTKGIPFESWTIDLTLDIGLENEKLAEFSLQLDNSVGFGLYRVFDKSTKFGIIINIKNTGDFVPRHLGISQLGVMLVLLVTPPNNNQNLCLITDTSVVVVRPVYADGRTPIEHISAIIARHTVNGQQVDTVRISAYGCGSNPDYANNIFAFLETLDRDAKLELTATHLLPQTLSSSAPVDHTPETSFELPNNEYLFAKSLPTWNINPENQRLKTRLIPLTSFHPILQHCPDGTMLTLLYSPSRNLFFAIEQRENNLSRGMKVFSYAPASQLKPCRPIA